MAALPPQREVPVRAAAATAADRRGAAAIGGCSICTTGGCSIGARSTGACVQGCRHRVFERGRRRRLLKRHGRRLADTRIRYVFSRSRQFFLPSLERRSRVGPRRPAHLLTVARPHPGTAPAPAAASASRALRGLRTFCGGSRRRFPWGRFGVRRWRGDRLVPQTGRPGAACGRARCTEPSMPRTRRSLKSTFASSDSTRIDSACSSSVTRDTSVTSRWTIS